jgi:hypothetical protein
MNPEVAVEHLRALTACHCTVPELRHAMDCLAPYREDVDTLAALLDERHEA